MINNIMGKIFKPKKSAIAIGAIVFALSIFISCGNDENDPQVPHTPSAHLDVNLDGTYSCEYSTACTPKIWTTVGGVPVYRVLGVDDYQMEEGIKAVEDGFKDYVNDVIQSLLIDKLDEVHIAAAGDFSFKTIDGKRVLSIKFDEDVEFLGIILSGIATVGLEPEPE